MECDSWNKDVLRGILVDYKEGNELLLGNHNYCRNPGGIEVRTKNLILKCNLFACITIKFTIGFHIFKT